MTVTNVYSYHGTLHNNNVTHVKYINITFVKNEIMEERLIQLLKAEGINSTRFAERIGVQRSSISHILSGRNKPSFDFIIKILENFPSLNPDWLLRGKGLMYRNEIPHQPGLFDSLTDMLETKVREETLVEPVRQTVNYSNEMKYSESGGTKGDNSLPMQGKIPGEKPIEKIVIFFTDHTFRVYTP